MNNVNKVFTVGNERELVDSDGDAIGTVANPLHVKNKELTINDLLSSILTELKIIKRQLNT